MAARKAEAEKYGVRFLGASPLDINIRETSDSGAPVVAASPEFAAGQTLFRSGPRRARGTGESGPPRARLLHRLSRKDFSWTAASFSRASRWRPRPSLLPPSRLPARPCRLGRRSADRRAARRRRSVDRPRPVVVWLRPLGHRDFRLQLPLLPQGLRDAGRTRGEEEAAARPDGQSAAVRRFGAGGQDPAGGAHSVRPGQGL